MAHRLRMRLPWLGLEEGQDLVECALLLALVATGLILILTALAGGVDELFHGAGDALACAGAAVI